MNDKLKFDISSFVMIAYMTFICLMFIILPYLQYNILLDYGNSFEQNQESIQKVIEPAHSVLFAFQLIAGASLISLYGFIAWVYIDNKRYDKKHINTKETTNE